MFRGQYRHRRITMYRKFIPEAIMVRSEIRINHQIRDFEKEERRIQKEMDAIPRYDIFVKI